LPDIYETLEKFFEQTFNKDAGVPHVDAVKASEMVLEVIKKYMGFKKGDFDA
jgi:hypothetical protein